ncbi:MAG: TolC family protein [Ignavibacteriae bacterium]|nr:TolC family protein [Ignavibacteriota bacterium]
MNNHKLKMKNTIINLLLIILILLISSKFKAQSIDSLVNEAIANNPQLKSLQFKIKSSEFRSESINFLPPPNLSVEFSQIPVNEYNIINQSISNSIALSQMFPLGGKLSAMSEVEKKNTRVEGDNFDAYKVSLIAQVKMSYFNLWLIDRKIEIQKSNISLLKDFARSIEVAFYTNRIIQADLLSIQSEIASNDAQLLIAEKQREAAIYTLNKFLGRNLNSKDVFAIEDFEVDSLVFNQSQLEEILNNSNPSLTKMNNMIDMNKAMIIANNKELIPDLMVQGMLMRMPKGMVLTSSSDLTMLEPKTEIMYSLMFSINLPFAPWSIGKLKNKEEELVSGINSIEQEKIDMQRDMYAKLKEVLVKYNTAIELTKLYDKNVIPLYINASESQTTAYQNGKTGISTVLDSYRMLLMQKMNYYMSKADVQMSLAEVEMMVGSNLKNLLLSEGNY